MEPKKFIGKFLEEVEMHQLDIVRVSLLGEGTIEACENGIRINSTGERHFLKTLCSGIFVVILMLIFGYYLFDFVNILVTIGVVAFWAVVCPFIKQGDTKNSLIKWDNIEKYAINIEKNIFALKTKSSWEGASFFFHCAECKSLMAIMREKWPYREVENDNR